MTEKQGSWRRRRFIVDATFQYALLRLLVALWVFFTAVQGWFMYYLYSGPVFDFEQILNQPDVKIIASGPPQFVGLMVLAAILGLIVVVAVGVHLSHRVAGPIFRLKESLKRVASGELGFVVRFRDGDYVGDLQELFNGMLQALRDRAENDVEQLKSVEATLPKDAPARVALERLRREKEALLEPSGREATPAEALMAEPLSPRPAES